MTWLMLPVLSLCVAHWPSLVFLLLWIFMRSVSALHWHTRGLHKLTFVRRNTFFGRRLKSQALPLVYMVSRE